MGILSSHTRRDMMIEALGVSLQQTLMMATVGGGGGTSPHYCLTLLITHSRSLLTNPTSNKYPYL